MPLASRNRAAASPHSPANDGNSSGHEEVDAGKREQPEHPAHLAAQSARVDEHDALAQLGVLVGELERHSPAEGLAHDGRPLDAEDVEQVPDGAGVAAQRVVAGRLVRGPVPEEVGGDHREPRLQEPHGRDPGVRTAGDAVEQDQDRTRPRLPVGHPGPVQHQVLHRIGLARSPSRRTIPRVWRPERTADRARGPGVPATGHRDVGAAGRPDRGHGPIHPGTGTPQKQARLVHQALTDSAHGSVGPPSVGRRGRPGGPLGPRTPCPTGHTRMGVRDAGAAGGRLRRPDGLAGRLEPGALLRRRRPEHGGRAGTISLTPPSIRTRTITLDKLPGAFWLQALSAQLFGVRPWALAAPQVLEGLASVLLLFATVRRLRGPRAALVASGILAVAPAVHGPRPRQHRRLPAHREPPGRRPAAGGRRRTAVGCSVPHGSAWPWAWPSRRRWSRPG